MIRAFVFKQYLSSNSGAKLLHSPRYWRPDKYVWKTNLFINTVDFDSLVLPSFRASFISRPNFKVPSSYIAILKKIFFVPPQDQTENQSISVKYEKKKPWLNFTCACVFDWYDPVEWRKQKVEISEKGNIKNFPSNNKYILIVPSGKFF